jgi:hypothetical protein
MINGSQLLFLIPLFFMPATGHSDLYDEGVRYTKGAFGNLLCTSSSSASALFSYYPNVKPSIDVTVVRAHEDGAHVRNEW